MLNCKNTAIIEKLKCVFDGDQVAGILQRYRIYGNQITCITYNAIYLSGGVQVEGRTVNALVRNNYDGSWEFCNVSY